MCTRCFETQSSSGCTCTRRSKFLTHSLLFVLSNGFYRIFTKSVLIGTFFTKYATFQFPFRFDLVDLSRQFLVNFAGKLYADAMEAYQAKDILSLAGFKLEFINLLNTLDTILGSNEHFLLGRQWLNPAKSIPGANDEDKIQYEYNARNQITLWGPEENIRRSVIDYAGDTNETKFT